MESILKEALGSVTLTPSGRRGGGCINQGEAFLVDSGTVFVKSNSKKKAKLMFDGELEGLKAIVATDTVQVPVPIVALENPRGGAVLVMEYLDMKGLHTYSKQLGEDLAKLHLHNIVKVKKTATETGFNQSDPDECRIERFGFHVPTCCGYLPMDNTWRDNWVTFYARNRLEPQIKLVEKDYGDREVIELWSQLKLKLPTFFSGLEILPSLLHGDLWGGNVGETCERPVAFDPATFYGHHEYDLAIAAMFGGFNKAFYSEYHKFIPQQPGFNKRQDLYKLFHNLNHWNHFGAGYRDSSLKLMRSLVN